MSRSARHTPTASIGVVLPVYNTAPTQLSEALRSIARQSLKPQEVIVVDDCSHPPVRTSDLPSINDVTISVVRLDRNRGPAHARNVGVAESAAHIIAFLDSDDVWHPHVLSTHVAALRSKRSDASCLAAFSTDGVSLINRAFPEKRSCTFSDMATRTVVHTVSAFAVRRSVYCDLGGMDEMLPPCEDLDFYLYSHNHYNIEL